jgi:hypothetical protein
MLLNGAAGTDRCLWGLNAPFRSGAPERREPRKGRAFHESRQSLATKRRREPRKGRAFHESRQSLATKRRRQRVSPARDGPSMSLDKVLRRSVDDNAWDEESDEVWRGSDRG